MSMPSHDDRVAIWRYTYARSSLIESCEAAKFLAANRTQNRQLQQALLCEMVIAYARPFTKSQITTSKRIIPLDEKVVPAEFRDLHNEHLEMRDRAIGHKDAAAFQPTALNRVIVRVDDTGFELQTTSPHDMSDSALQRTIELCHFLVSHCEAEVQKYTGHFAGVSKGVYFLNVDESPNEWLEKKH